MVSNYLIERKVTKAIEGLVKHVGERRYTFCRTIFATSDDVCWELVYCEGDETGDPNYNIVVYKWDDCEPARLAEFCTDYCFNGFDTDEVALGSMGQRLLDFILNEV